MTFRKAHKELWKAIRKGKFKNSSTSCKICGSIRFLQYHHEDYRKPLEVIVLCNSCHRKLHKIEKNFKRAYLKAERNKYGRFGKEKPICFIFCLNCKKRIAKNNPKQKYCKNCMIKLDTRHRGLKNG